MHHFHLREEFDELLSYIVVLPALYLRFMNNMMMFLFEMPKILLRLKLRAPQLRATPLREQIESPL